METAFRSDERFTQAEFFDWLQERPSGDINHYELLGGHIVMTPPAGFPHSPVAVRIVSAIFALVDERQLGIVNESSAGFDLPSGDTVEPDVSFICAEKWKNGPKPRRGRFYEIVPDLVVEILSPATSKRDRTEKKKIYEKNGIREYWIVSPDRRDVTVHRLAGEEYAAPVHVVRGAVESFVLAGFTLPLAKIFADSD